MKWTRTFAVMGTLIAGSLGLSGCDNTTSPSTDPPTAPVNVTLSVSGTDLTVSWDAVSNADSYDVEAATAGEAARSASVDTAGYTFTAMTEGATYTVQVTAVNMDGEASSDLMSVTIDEHIVQVSADVLENTTWTSDKVYILTQPIFVGADCGVDGTKDGCTAVTLTIEPGTTILGKTDVPQGIRGAYLVVNRGSKLMADANANRAEADKTLPPNPDSVIVFTSDKPRGQRARGDWGGLVIDGRAPTNAGTEAQGEGDSGFYGGTDEMDNSGIIRGVRIEFAGDDVTPTDQLNGLAPQGVGAGTTISYVQVHYNTDDGVEPFGGTVSMDHMVMTGEGDDTVDGTDGYRGFIQFIIGQQRGDNADRGFEISNNGDDGDASPQGTAVLANATMIGASDGVVSGTIAGPESGRGVEFREGSRYRLYNTILAGFSTGFRIAGAAAQVAAQNRMDGSTTPDSTLSAEGLILFNNGQSYEDTFAQTFFETAAFNNMVADPGFDSSVYDTGSMDSPPDFTLTGMPAGYTAFDLSTISYDDDLIAPADGRTLVATDYAGAVAPGTALTAAWYYGWTIWSTGGEDSRPNQDGN